MKHTPLLMAALASVLAAASYSTVLAQQAAAPAARDRAAAAPAAPKARPGLFFREEWKQQTPPENPDLPVSQQYVRNPALELKLYGPDGKDRVITGKDNDQ